jgi:hypothetical protein
MNRTQKPGFGDVVSDRRTSSTARDKPRIELVPVKLTVNGQT